jgi:hypothetical protein
MGHVSTSQKAESLSLSSRQRRGEGKGGSFSRVINPMEEAIFCEEEKEEEVSV